MLLSSLNTGSTDLRETEVQQPKTTATWSWLISSRAFSANSGQLEAGSTTTGTSFLPSSPPFLFCSAMSMSMTSFRVVSEIAIVPESECRMPTLIVSSAARAGAVISRPAAMAPAERSLIALNILPLIETSEQGVCTAAGDATAVPSPAAGAKSGDYRRKTNGLTRISKSAPAVSPNCLTIR